VQNKPVTGVRTIARRVVFLGVIALQLLLVARGYRSDHKEFAFQMFPEASTWQAEVVRVLPNGDRVPVEQPWDGYSWDRLVRDRGLQDLTVRHHADAGVDSQLAFLREALDYVATHTPSDTRTRYYEARVTFWHNDDAPRTVVYRSGARPEAGA